jgi:hypothetical protein
MITILSTSNIAPLLLSQSKTSLIITSIPFRLLYAINPITQTIKSSTKAIAPPYALIRRCTKSALKKRNKIGDKNDLYDNPA